MSAAVENTLPPLTESKSQKKKKAKAEAAAAQQTATPETPAQESSEPIDSNGTYEHPHLKELVKQIRSINKRLAGLQKTDAVIGENPGVSLDDLVKQRKLNPDQKAAAEKKPQLQSQLQQLEEQVKVFQGVNNDYQAQISKMKEEWASQHEKELTSAREETETSGRETSGKQLKEKLLVFSQFLRTAAAKRNVEENTSDPVENEAFEGALLLAYGGDEKAVETAVAIIEGSEEKVPNIEGTLLDVTYAQIRKVSIENTPFQTEEAWVDSVAEANAATGDLQSSQEGASAVPAGSDPTLVNAGLTELDTSAPTTNGVVEPERDGITSPIQTSAGDEAGNLSGDRWDTGAGAAQESLDEGYEIVPRPNDEVDIPAPSAPPASAPAVEGLLEREKASWADEATAAAGQDAVGNQAGEAWDLKLVGAEAAAPQGNGWAEEGAAAAPVVGEDGFQEIQRHQGRGGRGGRGGEYRGRGGRGRGRGDGEFRGGRGGRGEYRGGRGRGEGGEYRGRGGRGRGGPQGGAPQAPRA